MDLPHGDGLIDVKVEEIYEAYLDALDEYIGAEIIIPGRDALPDLVKVKKCKRDAYNNTIEEKNYNPILETKVYELEVPDGRIYKFVVNVLS